MYFSDIIYGTSYNNKSENVDNTLYYHYRYSVMHYQDYVTRSEKNIASMHLQEMPFQNIVPMLLAVAGYLTLANLVNG